MAEKKVTKLLVVGPKDKGNFAKVLRFHLSSKKNPLELARGQMLTVGKEITETEAKQLLNNSTWEIKEVSN
ncbi:hypothetical protein [Peribacillus asahii]|uniref:hypothetical protein n=1 Tax=Peribacillus asahii TaxID=228899 RepID=UPI00207AB871|nr:hypothetical protein [Peribacillus asahii]USK72680.1 hypothetical protein LIS76_23445 [Peribacillus asahii]USK72717.1 hypothetical protein LIS76_24025 [Peribacillus asahii]